ncbi:iron-containing alcohol dehydrogenase family protein [Haladaptatus halobius]|uniref:iron-containing alcohol dehydrogenase family protein n=1 Tax=Haladaptatus halobius TaxID=2884875 RepID=UPI001D0BD2C7|nr:iron-containing alcohol dehydrogenase family protein [Haladaptatus halobius]
MSLTTSMFVHGFTPGIIHYGRGCISDIGQTLAENGLENAMIVCGQNIGANERLMTPVKEGLGDQLVGVFNETTPVKSIETVFDGIDRANNLNADVLVAVGGGSSLDIATGISLLAKDNRSLKDVQAEVQETGTITLPEDSDQLLPMVPVPTTLAGADLSVAAGIIVPTNEGKTEVIVAHEDLMPTAFFYDPDLFDTTPMDVLAGSAINGFDKGIEAIYSRFANPMTDATAIRGLKYLRSSLPGLRETEDPAVIERAVLGIILVQYGVSVPGAYKINIVHAFGHALRNQFGIQQGVAHAVIVPHALRLIFEEGGGRPEVLAEGLVTDPEPENAEGAVVEAVTCIRDGLGLPKHLRDIDGVSREELRDAAKLTYEDDFLSMGPPNFNPSVDDIEEALQSAW